MRSLALLALTIALPATAADPPTFDLWPGPVPGEKGNVGEETFTPKTGPIKSYTVVTKPTLTVYRPSKDKDTGAAIVIAPGGGYRMLAWEHEGTQVGEWLQSIGVTGVLLKYRIPRRPDAPKDAPPVAALQDAQRAVSLTRSKAKEWGIDPHRIGFLGFSAGGHLTAWTMTNDDRRSYEPADDADKASCRPDFAVLIYPGGVVDRQSRDRLSPEIRITKTTPPSFLAVSADDAGSFDGTVKLMQALRAAGVSAELHAYAGGGHGYGMRAGDKPQNAWPKRCEEWMRASGFLSSAASSGSASPVAAPRGATAAPPAAGGASPVAPGAKLEKLADGFQFTEGPTADRDGNVYFTDQPTDRILKWSTDGKLSTFMQGCGRSNGLCFDAAGKLWACADEKNELWVIDVATKEKTVVVKEFEGKLLNGPNDLWVTPEGGVYFTDPFYKRPYWNRGPKEQPSQGVYYRSPTGTVTRVDGDYGQANGIVGTPDGKTLYVADIGRKKTWQYAVRPDGSLADRKLFCEMGSDGMTLDDAGNVYLTGPGVVAFDRTGKEVARIAVPEPWTANVCFGGADGRTLFVTAGKSVYGLKMTTKGASRQ